MAYDAKLDKELKKWRFGDLQVSLNKYGKGEPKMQVGPRFYDDKEGGERFKKAGRLAMDEVKWLAEILPEILKLGKVQEAL